MRRFALIAAAAAVLALPAAAAAGSGLLLGIDDDMGKWAANSPVAGSIADLGATVQRITVIWLPGQAGISGIEEQNVQSAIERAPHTRTVLAVYGRRPADAPHTPAARTEFCTFVRSLLAHHPSIRDVVIWNEVNRAEFWWPQKEAPAAYAALLARCYDVLHAFRPSVNVIDSTATRPDSRGTNAGTFIRGLGQAYRASRRGTPIVDTFGHNPYPAFASEKPWARHPAGGSISEGDYTALMQAYYDAFAGTPQPLPGQGQTTVWYLEDGFQTAVDPAQAAAYSGAETDPRPVSAAGQAAQLVDAIRLAYCEPAVGAFFNFLLVDEANLGGWQSGLMWATLQPKPAYDAFKQVAREVAAGSVDCTQLSGGPAPVFQPVSTVGARVVSWNGVSVEIEASEPSVYRAELLDALTGRTVVDRSGSVSTGRAVVRFPAVVTPGSYRVRVRLEAAYAPSRAATVVGKPFRVAPAEPPKATPGPKPPVFAVVPG
ncbi:MAG TPA: hypothetical protein VGJ25_14560 [Gaiellaceae bacterium]